MSLQNSFCRVLSLSATFVLAALAEAQDVIYCALPDDGTAIVAISYPWEGGPGTAYIIDGGRAGDNQGIVSIKLSDDEQERPLLEWLHQ